MHLQLSPQNASPSKHSQYFFKHIDFLQLQPDVCPCTGVTLDSNANSFRSFVTAMALCRTSSNSALLLHSTQLQVEQYRKAAKHSQYNFKHFDFLQLQFAGVIFSDKAGDISLGCNLDRPAIAGLKKEVIGFKSPLYGAGIEFVRVRGVFDSSMASAGAVRRTPVRDIGAFIGAVSPVSSLSSPPSSLSLDLLLFPPFKYVSDEL